MPAANSTGSAKAIDEPKRVVGRPWKKGESGNYSGRPKKDRALTAALEAAVDKQELADKLVELAMGGDMMAVRYIYDRIEGSPTQRHEVDAETVQRAMERLAEDAGLDLAMLRRDTEEIAGQLRLVR